MTRYFDGMTAADLRRWGFSIGITINNMRPGGGLVSKPCSAPASTVVAENLCQVKGLKGTGLKGIF
jgi:hypothetical protein